MNNTINTIEMNSNPGNDVGTTELANTNVFIREVTARYIGARRASFTICNATDVKRFASGVMKDNSREHFIALFLDTAHRVISFSVVSIGTANATLVHPREVFQHAMLAGAHALVVAHNHPSGRPEPSEQDHRVTQMLVAAGEIVGIHVLDHVVFTEDDSVSFKDKGWLKQSSSPF